MAHQRRASEAVQVLAASFQDAGVWNFAVVYDLAGAGIGFVGMEEAENRRMGRSGNWEAHSGIGGEARSETAVDHSEIDSVVRSGKGAVHSGTAEGHSGMEKARSGTEEVAHSGIEMESRAHLAGGIVEAAQTLDFEADQNFAVVGEMETAIVGRAVIAERKVEERQNRTNFGVDLQRAFAAAAAGEDNLASQPVSNSLSPSRMNKLVG